MTVGCYDQTVNEVDFFESYDGRTFWAVNQSYWYSATMYSKEQAIQKYLESR